jgi:capsular polysaccharide biosynthesis protein
MAVTPAEPARRLFVSRSGGFANRACRNQTDVEQYFAAQGFSVFYPEQHTLAEQAGIFGQAEVIAGFAGSAMFNLMFCERLRAMLLLTHEGYDARNEYLIGSVVGADLHYFWSTPDVAHPEGGWSQAGFDSAWAFDFGRNQADLDALLAQLG